MELGIIYKKESAATGANISFSNPMHSVQQLRATIQDKDDRILEKEAQLAAKDEEIAEYKRKVSAYEEMMNKEKSSTIDAINDRAIPKNRDNL